MKEVSVPFPIWAKVVLWVGVIGVFFGNIFYLPYAVVLSWAVPVLWNRWMAHLAVVEEMVYLSTSGVKSESEVAKDEA